MTEIYQHYVANTNSTFEITPPDRRTWSKKFWTVAATGLPFLVAELDGRVAGYALCSPWKLRAAYANAAEPSMINDHGSMISLPRT